VALVVDKRALVRPGPALLRDVAGSQAAQPEDGLGAQAGEHAHHLPLVVAEDAGQVGSVLGAVGPAHAPRAGSPRRGSSSPRTRAIAAGMGRRRALSAS
jgi:hypothetical protein